MLMVKIQTFINKVDIVKYFETNISAGPKASGSLVVSRATCNTSRITGREARPSQLAQRFEHTPHDGRFSTLPAELAPFFDSWHSAVTFLSLQHGAVAHVEDCNGLAHACIDLPIDVEAVKPLRPVEPVGHGEFLQRIGAVGAPFCFVVPGVAFRVLSERLI
ncbi:hypothetical protein [Burkholderia sp. F1]|uniref:hypothetical protein n=1 Tax=Burkholderia sp. F1 TaxID=3366817 RepID=UPI003D702BF3